MVHVSTLFSNTLVHIPPKRKERKNEWIHKFIHSYHPHFPRPYIWHFLSQNNIHLQLNMLPFFRPIFHGGFKLLLWNVCVCFEVLATQFTFQRWEQSEITQCKVSGVCWMFHHFNVAVLKPLLLKNSHMRPSFILMENPPSKKFWSFLPDMIKESFQ